MCLYLFVCVHAYQNRHDDEQMCNVRTPGHYAAFYGNASFLKALFLKHASPNACNLNRCSLLHFAAGVPLSLCLFMLVPIYVSVSVSVSVSLFEHQLVLLLCWRRVVF